MAGATLHAIDEARIRIGQGVGKRERHLQSVLQTKKTNQSQDDWPQDIPKLTDEDVRFYAELSDRETGSDFFDKKKRR